MSRPSPGGPPSSGEPPSSGGAGRVVRAEYELQPDLIEHRDALAEELGDGATVEPLGGGGPPGSARPPDGVVVEMRVAAPDPLSAIGVAARRLAAAFDALDLPVRAVSLECEGLPPVRIETRPDAHPFAG